MKSKLTKNQTKEYTKRVDAKGPYDYDKITVKVRYDDSCGNGHNSFSITAHTTCRGREDMAGAIHEEIVKHFPELAHLIKWHLMSSTGPLHYLANTLYLSESTPPQKGWIRSVGAAKELAHCFIYISAEKAEEYMQRVFERTGLRRACMQYDPDPKTAKTADIESARHCAVWPDATREQLQDKEALKARLPALIEDFTADILDLGFEF